MGLLDIGLADELSLDDGFGSVIVVDDVGKREASKKKERRIDLRLSVLHIHMKSHRIVYIRLSDKTTRDTMTYAMSIHTPDNPWSQTSIATRSRNGFACGLVPESAIRARRSKRRSS